MATYGTAVRRGLPRHAGADYWPPIAEARTVVALNKAVPELPIAEDAPLTQDFTRSTSDLAASDTIAAASTRASGVRRGLPRREGEQKWPPASQVPPMAVVHDNAVVHLSDVTPKQARRGLHRAGEAAPALRASPEPTAGLVAEIVQKPKKPVFWVDPPFAFARAVWPDRTLRLNPDWKAEPKRYGPYTRLQWVAAVVVAGGGLLFSAAMAVFAVRWLLSLEVMQDFLTRYPGEYQLPADAPVGHPPWLGWQHFFNVFLMALIIRSGLQVRNQKRPPGFWSPRWNSTRKISINLWFHQSLDIVWILNGAIFIVMLFVSGQWMRIVPTSWEVLPNALSAALQYASLHWPTENGWVNYNSLQQIAYFTSVFVAAPIAIVTGVRMSGIWPQGANTLNKLYPLEWARAAHVPVMIYFVLFIIVHVTLVFATGALRNLNHMYAAQGSVEPTVYADNWAGFWIFIASMVVIAGAVVAARPLVLAPIARLFGSVSRM